MLFVSMPSSADPAPSPDAAVVEQPCMFYDSNNCPQDCVQADEGFCLEQSEDLRAASCAAKAVSCRPPHPRPALPCPALPWLTLPVRRPERALLCFRRLPFAALCQQRWSLPQCWYGREWRRGCRAPRSPRSRSRPDSMAFFNRARHVLSPCVQRHELHGRLRVVLRPALLANGCALRSCPVGATRRLSLHAAASLTALVAHPHTDATVACADVPLLSSQDCPSTCQNVQIQASPPLYACAESGALAWRTQRRTLKQQHSTPGHGEPILLLCRAGHAEVPPCLSPSRQRIRWPAIAIWTSRCALAHGTRKPAAMTQVRPYFPLPAAVANARPPTPAPHRHWRPSPLSTHSPWHGLCHLF